MSNNSEVILTFDNIEITEDDLNCLRAHRYLNDKIINFYLKYMYRMMLTPEQQRRVHIFDSFFSEALDQMDEARTVRWLRRVNIFEKDFLLVPVNIDEHWFLMIICYPMNVGGKHGESAMRRRSRILTLDSMPLHAHDKKPQMLRYLRNFIRCACVVQRHMSEEEIGNLTTRLQNVDVDVKEQVNNFDCGIHLLANAEKFLTDTFEIREIIDPEVEFRLNGARLKRNALRKLIRKLAEATEIEKSAINSRSH
ncbi:uncharacterized protein LOC129578745 [Sitodiplosis mosellana]|uniref:uncharacterized protein LOC129578745 n=1 Tax=Sitodiplosis mosellana TaxID=263140 RepID=UPI002444B8D0|nr:uncharacterized protein LOC129578745 [Sitodiplosis mosellana]